MKKALLFLLLLLGCASPLPESYGALPSDYMVTIVEFANKNGTSYVRLLELPRRAFAREAAIFGGSPHCEGYAVKVGISERGRALEENYYIPFTFLISGGEICQYWEDNCSSLSPSYYDGTQKSLWSSRRACSGKEYGKPLLRYVD